MRELTLVLSKSINATKLDGELRSALLTKYLSLSSGRNWLIVRLDDGATPGDDATTQSILDAHDATPLPDPIVVLKQQAGPLPLDDKTLTQIDAVTSAAKDLPSAVALINSLAKQVAILQARLDRYGIP